MNRLTGLLSIILATGLFTACKKDEVELTPLASLNVTNVITGGTTAKFGSRTATIANNGYTQFGLLAGSSDVYIYPATDSLHPYYTSNKFTAATGDVYSLFLGGTPAAVDAVMVKDAIPYRQDSTAGIRFINLSPNSTPLTITLSASPTVAEVSGLAYKQYTDFKSYPALSTTAYTFQVRDAATASPAAPLATFALTASTVPRFANITVVIKGLVGGSPAISTLRVNNDR